MWGQSDKYRGDGPGRGRGDDMRDMRDMRMDDGYGSHGGMGRGMDGGGGRGRWRGMDGGSNDRRGGTGGQWEQAPNRSGH